MANARKRLQGQLAVVTGASRGIGLALCEALAYEGCNLAITARNAEQLQKAALQLEILGIRVLNCPSDVRSEQSVESFFAAVKAKFGEVDVLINNAGIAHKLAPVSDLAPELWRQVIDINLTGTFLCSHFCLPLMRAGGTVINNLSVAASGSFPGHSGYNASKYGALGLTNTMREEVREKGIRVIALVPGPTDTEIWEQFWPERPRNRMMTAENVAEAVIGCLTLPANAVVEEIKMRPIGGTLER
jgi:NAD(P)-dependent dehydrogenase (short-subunit alcohol dehydrogenase family)